MNSDWINTLTITEVNYKDKDSKPKTIFYIQEKPFKPGYSYQSTATSQDAAKWVITQLKKDFNI